VHVFDTAGKLLGKILVEQSPANCAFGGADRTTLYLTARTALYAIDLAVEGAGGL
jgi:gluconolactonase